ncbi:MAG: metallophosphoesterase [Bacteroidales bacterium]|nr:metallophosphoesterase [Bacteroidales bacterium]
MEIEVDKPVPDWNILLVSDLHLGTMTPTLLQKQVETMNALQPDLVLMVGDQFELSPKDVEQAGYSEVLRSIQAPQGVFVVNGNHEVRHGYLRMQNYAADFYKTMNMYLLSDTSIVLDNQLTLIGRMDTMRGVKRRSLESIMANTPKDIPNILLDHQPLDLAAAQHCDIDLQLSGHMHNGQLFPMNMVQWAKCLFNRKLHYGYRKMGNTNYYVTAGLGGSGAPIRIGTTGEIVLIRFKQKTP